MREKPESLTILSGDLGTHLSSKKHLKLFLSYKKKKINLASTQECKLIPRSTSPTIWSCSLQGHWSLAPRRRLWMLSTKQPKYGLIYQLMHAQHASSQNLMLRSHWLLSIQQIASLYLMDGNTLMAMRSLIVSISAMIQTLESKNSNLLE